MPRLWPIFQTNTNTAFLMFFLYFFTPDLKIFKNIFQMRDCTVCTESVSSWRAGTPRNLPKGVYFARWAKFTTQSLELELLWPSERLWGVMYLLSSLGEFNIYFCRGNDYDRSRKWEAFMKKHILPFLCRMRWMINCTRSWGDICFDILYSTDKWDHLVFIAPLILLNMILSSSIQKAVNCMTSLFFAYACEAFLMPSDLMETLGKRKYYL